MQYRRLPEVEEKKQKTEMDQFRNSSYQHQCGKKKPHLSLKCWEKHRHLTLSQKRGKRGLAEVIGRCCFRLQMLFVDRTFGIVTNLV